MSLRGHCKERVAVDGGRDSTIGRQDGQSILEEVSTFVCSSRDIWKWSYWEMGEIATGKVCGGKDKGHTLSICRR